VWCVVVGLRVDEVWWSDIADQSDPGVKRSSTDVHKAYP
jgi:hypothetical protein